MEENAAGTMSSELACSEEETKFKKGMRAVKGIAAKIGVKNIIIACSFLLIGAAVILNFVLFGNSNPVVGEGDLLGSGLSEDLEEDTAGAENTSYFATAKLSRRQARDQALAVLQTVVESNTADATSKEQASVDIGRIAEEIQTESDIETLIKSKGFEECVAVIAEGSASVIVRSDGLLPNELSQIKEIVYEHAGIDPLSIKIIEQHS